MITENLKHNDLSISHQTSVVPLKWGDFSTLPESGAFDLILGSDIIYNNYILAPLAITIAHYIKANRDSVAYIANNKVRYDNYGKEFETEIAKAGLEIVERSDIVEEKGSRVMRVLVIKK